MSLWGLQFLPKKQIKTCRIIVKTNSLVRFNWKNTRLDNLLLKLTDLYVSLWKLSAWIVQKPVTDNFHTLIHTISRSSFLSSFLFLSTLYHVIYDCYILQLQQRKQYMAMKAFHLNTKRQKYLHGTIFPYGAGFLSPCQLWASLQFVWR